MIRVLKRETPPIGLHAYAGKTWQPGRGKNWWCHDVSRQRELWKKSRRPSRRFLQLEIISKDKLIKNEQWKLKIVISSSSRSSYTLFKCSSLIGWPNSAGSIFNLKLSIWWSDESFPKGTNYYNNSMDSRHFKCSSVRKPADKFYSQY